MAAGKWSCFFMLTSNHVLHALQTWLVCMKQCIADPMGFGAFDWKAVVICLCNTARTVSIFILLNIAKASCCMLGSHATCNLDTPICFDAHKHMSDSDSSRSYGCYRPWRIIINSFPSYVVRWPWQTVLKEIKSHDASIRGFKYALCKVPH